MFVKREDILQYLSDLNRYARYLCKNNEDAKDLVQITFEKSWTNFNRFKRSANLKSWLFKIMYNSFIDNLRKMKYREDVDLETNTVNGNETRYINQILDLDKAINLLNHELRSVLVLATIEGYDYKSIGKMMSIPTGTVMSRLHRARKQLLQLLEVKSHNPKKFNIVELKNEQK